MMNNDVSKKDNCLQLTWCVVLKWKRFHACSESIYSNTMNSTSFLEQIISSIIYNKINCILILLFMSLSVVLCYVLCYVLCIMLRILCYCVIYLYCGHILTCSCWIAIIVWQFICIKCVIQLNLFTKVSATLYYCS